MDQELSEGRDYVPLVSKGPEEVTFEWLNE